MSFLDNNALSPMPIKDKIFKSNNINQYRSIDTTSLRPLNRTLKYNKSEYGTPLSSISNNNFQVYNDQLSKNNTNTKINEKRIKKKINNSSSQDLYINNLKNKLIYLRQTNKELNNDYQQIAKKSKLLINDIANNNLMFSKLKKDYENGLKKNNELKQKCHNLLNIYKIEALQNYDDKNEDKLEIEELKKEQKKLILLMKSKEKIINYLENTLKILEKNGLEESNNRNNKINDINNDINDFNNKIEENKNNINDLNHKKIDLKNNKKYNNINDNKIANINIDTENKLLNGNNELNDKNIDNYETFYKNKNDIKNKIISINNPNNLVKIEKGQLNKSKGNYLELEDSFFGFEDSFDKISYKLFPLKTNRNNYSNYKNLLINDFEINQFHKKNQSLELEDNTNQLILNYIEDISPIIVNYTSPNISEKKKEKKNILKNKKIRNNGINNINNQKNNSSYLYSITKEGEILEFDILKKIYFFIDASKIKNWNYFISEYVKNYEGSLLLNTFQGLFIITGKKFSDLYYFSKKYNSISKMKSFKYNHKNGGLILSQDNKSLLVIGGETQNIEILTFENGLISYLPPLLNKRVNSAFTFIGNLLFAFFGKNNSTIEYLNMKTNKKWELINFKINTNKTEKINLEGHVAIPINSSEILILGGRQNKKLMIFDYKEKNIDVTNIDMPFIEKVGKYLFDKDKYFNVFFGNDKLGIDESSLNQLIAMDSKGNIHSFDNNFNYSVTLFENNVFKDN